MASWSKRFKMKDGKVSLRAKAGLRAYISAGNIKTSALKEDKQQRIINEIHGKKLPTKEFMTKNNKSQRFSPDREIINNVIEL